MSSVHEIQVAIGKLSPLELEDLRLWMDEQYADPIDLLLKGDVQAGQMDSRIRQALAEHP